MNAFLIRIPKPVHELSRLIVFRPFFFFFHVKLVTSRAWHIAEMTLETEKYLPLFLLLRGEVGAQVGDRKGLDHQICPPQGGKTPCSLNTWRHALTLASYNRLG